MSLEPDQIIDRRRLKRRLGLWRIVAVLAVAAVVVVAVGRFDGLFGRNHVARLSIDNLIVDDADRDDAFAAVADDSSVGALIVRIDSLGGTMVGAEGIYRGMRAVAEKKPVVVVMGEMATSAGYYAALGADHVIARPSTLTGSIGVILQTADVTGLLDKLGIKPEIIKSRPLKAQPNPLEPFTPEAREATRAVVLDLYEMFIDRVAERRRMPRDRVMPLADGRVFSGRQARGHGLVDALGDEREARDWLEKDRGISKALPVKDVTIGEDGRFWSGLAGSALGKVLFSERLRLDGVVSVWHPELW